MGASPHTEHEKTRPGKGLGRSRGKSRKIQEFLEFLDFHRFSQRSPGTPPKGVFLGPQYEDSRPKSRTEAAENGQQISATMSPVGITEMGVFTQLSVIPTGDMMAEICCPLGVRLFARKSSYRGLKNTPLTSGRCDLTPGCLLCFGASLTLKLESSSSSSGEASALGSSGGASAPLDAVS